MGVGAQRSGTSWWNRLIVDHPDVVPPLVPVNPSAAPKGGPTKKELHYFDVFSTIAFADRDIELYYRFFPRPEGATIGEWTPSYMVDHWIPPLLQHAAPRAKLLIILRDPVERYRSAFGVRVRRRRAMGLREPPLERYASARGGRGAYRRSLYSAQITRLLGHFDRSQFLILQFERCVQSPLSELRRTYEFLGLDPGHRPEEAIRGGASADPKIDLPADFQNHLVTRLSDDIAELAKRCPEVDLRLWPHFRHLVSRPEPGRGAARR